MGKINKIKLSGITYDIQDLSIAALEARIGEDEEVTAAGLNALNDAVSGKVDTSTFETYSGSVETALSGKQDTLSAGTNITISGNVISADANNVVNVTQAEYDALVTGGTVDPTVLYNITDATPIDMSQYYTSAQTDSAIASAVSGKQDTLISGTNIKTINNENILGSGNIVIQGGGEVSSAITSGDTNPVQGGVLYNKFDEVEQVTAAGLNALNDKFDGLKLKKLTQSEYDALSGNTDSNTLYVIVN